MVFIMPIEVRQFRLPLEFTRNLEKTMVAYQTNNSGLVASIANQIAGSKSIKAMVLAGKIIGPTPGDGAKSLYNLTKIRASIAGIASYYLNLKLIPSAKFSCYLDFCCCLGVVCENLITPYGQNGKKSAVSSNLQ